jgi:hypothetical protein
MAKIFISHIHEDAAVAGALRGLIATELELEGEIFVSSNQFEMLVGDDWLAKIKRALTDASVVILLFSKRAVRRPWVNFEAGAAWLTGKAIMPVCFGNMTVGSMPEPYSRFYGARLPEEAHRIVRSIHRTLDLKTPEPPSPFSRDFQRAISDAESAIARSQGRPKPSVELRDFTDPYVWLDVVLKSHVDEP